MYLKHVPKVRITFLMPPPPHPTPKIIIQFFVEEIKYFNKICQLSATGTACNKIKHLLEYYFFNKFL